jgi:hypothetical protein
MEETSNRHGEEKSEPLAVVDRDDTKQDWIPTQSSYMVLEHSVVKQWRKLAFCFIIMAICNVGILHSAMKTKKLSMTRFTDREKKAPRRCTVQARHILSVYQLYAVFTCYHSPLA